MRRMFLERLSAQGVTALKYYQDPLYNKAKGTINDMPNCTDYAVCRAAEACDSQSPLKLFTDLPAGSFPNADQFFPRSGYPKGFELKSNSIACFANENGSMHVAFVERAYNETECLITDSRYDQNKNLRNDRYWRKLDNVKLEIGKTPVGIPGVGTLQGFIYLPVNDIRKRDTLVDQIEVTEELVNVRKLPEGDILLPGCFCPLGFYTIEETRVVNGYKWFKLQDDAWIREGYWTEFHPAVEDEKQKEIDMLNKRISAAITILSGGTL